MSDGWSQGSQQQQSSSSSSSRASMMWHVDDSSSKSMTDFSPSPDLEEVRPIRRVRSPSSPRAWASNLYKPKQKGRVYKPGYTTKGYPPHKPPSGSQRYHHSNNREYMDQKQYYHLKLQHKKWEQDKKKKKGWYQPREKPDPRLPPKQPLKQPPKQPPSSATTTGSPWSSSFRDQDTTDKYKKRTREWDQRKTSCEGRGPTRECEPPLTGNPKTARDRAIQKKRREIDEVYYQECETFGLVTKMLIQKNQSLELPIQSALQENLRDIGRRCVQAMEKFIEEYDSQH